MPQQQKQKGNPASKRMTNANLKARRTASWNRRQKQKEVNRKAQEGREAVNRVNRAEGIPTPWEVARAERARIRGERLKKRRAA